MIEAAKTVLAFIGVGGLLVMFLSVLGLRLTLTPRMKKKLAAAGNQWDSGTFDFGFIMTILFAWACALPPVQRTVRFQYLFPGLDVRASANWMEKTFSFGMVSGIVLVFFAGVLFELLEIL